MASRPWDAEAWQWDAFNETKLIAHGIEVEEVYQVWQNGPEWVPNKKAGSGDYKMIGRTDGGRALTIVVRYYPDQNVLRPITGWPSQPKRSHDTSRSEKNGD